MQEFNNNPNITIKKHKQSRYMHEMPNMSDKNDKRNARAIYTQGVMRLTRHSWKQLGANQHEKLHWTTKYSKETGNTTKV